MPAASCVRLRLTDRQIGQTLDLIDRTDEVVAGSARRRHARHRFRVAEPMRLVCPRETGHALYEVAPRDLSGKGMAALVGGFVHIGTICVTLVPRLDGGKQRLEGIVRACRHIAASLHEIGIEFVEPIEVSEFISEGSGDDGSPSAEILAELGRLGEEIAGLARGGGAWADVCAAAREMQRLVSQPESGSGQ